MEIINEHKLQKVNLSDVINIVEQYRKLLEMPLDIYESQEDRNVVAGRFLEYELSAIDSPDILINLSFGVVFG